MKSFHNIEKSGFRRGEYRGWSKSNGALWKIRKDGCGGWEAVPGHHDIRKYSEARIKTRTIADMSAKLESM